MGPYQSISALPEQARVGTSSLRRQVQLKAARPDINIISLRGNVNTRLKKLDQGEYDAIILASAGLIRLDYEQRIACHLNLEQNWLPAISQGVIGIECRTDDSNTQALISCFNHKESQVTTVAERSLNKTLEGGCQVPIGGFAQWINNNQIRLDAFVSNGDKIMVKTQETIDIVSSQPRESLAPKMVSLGIEVAEKLNKMGAQELLSEARASFSSSET